MNCGALKKDVLDLILPALAVNQTLSLLCIQPINFVSFLPGSSSFNQGRGKKAGQKNAVSLVTH